MLLPGIGMHRRVQLREDEMTENARAIFDRIPALKALTGVARIEAEEVIENALADAAEDAVYDMLNRELTTC